MMTAPPMNSKLQIYIASLKDFAWDNHWEKKLDINWEAPLMEYQSQIQWYWQRYWQQRNFVPQDDGGRLGVCPALGQAGASLWWNKSGHRHQEFCGTPVTSPIHPYT